MSILPRPDCAHLYSRDKFNLSISASFIDTKFDGTQVSAVEVDIRERHSVISKLSFVQDHFTNVDDHHIGELSWDLVQSPWTKKVIQHSPFPKVNKISNLTWINSKNFVFLGWEKNGELCSGSQLYKMHQCRNKKGSESILYEVEEITQSLPKHRPVRKGHDLGFYVDLDEFRGMDALNENFLYIFNHQSLQWEPNFKIQGLHPPATTGSSSVNLSIDDDDYIYIYGGQDRLGHVEEGLWCYNISQRKSQPLNRWRCILTPLDQPKPPRVHHLTMINHHDYLIMYGGFHEFSGKISNEIWGFNLISEHWFPLRTMGQLPPLVNAKMCMGSQSTLFIYGGEDSHGDTNDTMYVYKLHSTHLYKLPSGMHDNPGKRENFDMIYDEQLRKLIIIGGELDEHKSDLIHDCNEIEYTHVYELNWSILKELVIPLW